jgi:hypothetical protein
MSKTGANFIYTPPDIKEEINDSKVENYFPKEYELNLIVKKLSFS